MTDQDPKQLAERFPSGDAEELPDEARFDRAADGLCDVIMAIERTDYNCIPEPDLLELMEAYQTIRDICHECRQNQSDARRARERGDA